MRSYLQRSLAAYEKRLSVLLRTAANLNLQLHELNELRGRVEKAQLIAQESQRTGQSGNMSVEGRLICAAHSPSCQRTHTTLGDTTLGG
jgi:hypothetical protein